MSTISEFIKVKKAIKQPKKDSTNPQFKKGYVSLDGIIKSVDDAIKESDASLVWWQEIEDEVIYTILSDGDSDALKIKGFPLIAVQMNKVVATQQASPQALGSGLTYAKRYSLATAFGISSEIDDDANESQKAKNNYQKAQPKQSKPPKKDFTNEIKNAVTIQQLNNIYRQAEQTGQAESIKPLLSEKRIELNSKKEKNEVQGDFIEDLQKVTQKPKGGFK